MEVGSLEDSLDEFDANYLECYHQITQKLATSALGCNPQLKLSSPLLGPKDDAPEFPRGIQLSQSLELYGTYLDRARSFTDNEQLTNNEDNNHSRNEYHKTETIYDKHYYEDTESITTSYEENYNRYSNSISSDLSLSGISPLTMTSESFAPNNPCATFSTLHSGHNPTTGNMQRVMSLGNTQNTSLPSLRLRLLLTLLITPKFSGKKSERRNTVATYVGNPFYRGRMSPQRKKLISANNTFRANLASARCTFEIGEALDSTRA